MAALYSIKSYKILCFHSKYSDAYGVSWNCSISLFPAAEHHLHIISSIAGSWWEAAFSQFSPISSHSLSHSKPWAAPVFSSNMEKPAALLQRQGQWPDSSDKHCTKWSESKAKKGLRFERGEVRWGEGPSPSIQSDLMKGMSWSSLIRCTP